jgi:LmbE family N-acetylglucosaminyl deacetylase
MFNQILKRLVPIPSIINSKKAVFIGPHPDDIEIGAGAIVSKLVKSGCEVIYIIVTDGGAGYLRPLDTIDNLIKRRNEEAHKAAYHLGIKKVFMLGYEDGGNYSVDAVSIDIAKILIDQVPDLVICPDPSLPSEVHPDHIKCGLATKTAMIISQNRFVAFRNGIDIDETKKDNFKTKTLGFYYTHRPNSFIKVSKEDVLAMYEAIQMHLSQFPRDNAETSKEFLQIKTYLDFRFKRFGLKTYSKYAMGLFLMDAVHQHCFTEINEW